jgi:3'(2'), 5'-bisphosphate nucleotidase
LFKDALRFRLWPQAVAVRSGPSPFAARLAEIAHEAGQIILAHYRQGVTARTKPDASPVTFADEEAEVLIEARLRELEPSVPIIAEEAMAAGRRPEPGTRFFLVDPLDGTKEFLQRNGEFTVNIALIERGVPVCGVVHAPALGRLFIGESGEGEAHAFELAAAEGSALQLDRARAIRARKARAGGIVAIVSRSHRNSKTEEYLAHYEIAEMVAAGSSLKFCLIAAGEADLYPRHGRTMEWDIAAGHAVLEGAGGSVTQLDGSPFLYGKAGEGFANPHFVARGLP